MILVDSCPYSCASPARSPGGTDVDILAAAGAASAAEAEVGADLGQHPAESANPDAAPTTPDEGADLMAARASGQGGYGQSKSMSDATDVAAAENEGQGTSAANESLGRSHQVPHASHHMPHTSLGDTTVEPTMKPTAPRQPRRGNAFANSQKGLGGSGGRGGRHESGGDGGSVGGRRDSVACEMDPSSVAAIEKSGGGGNSKETVEKPEAAAAEAEARLSAEASESSSLVYTKGRQGALPALHGEVKLSVNGILHAIAVHVEVQSVPKDQSCFGHAVLRPLSKLDLVRLKHHLRHIDDLTGFLDLLSKWMEFGVESMTKNKIALFREHVARRLLDPLNHSQCGSFIKTGPAEWDLGAAGMADAIGMANTIGLIFDLNDPVHCWAIAMLDPKTQFTAEVMQAILLLDFQGRLQSLMFPNLRIWC
jgi:hypothetical protein